MSDQMTNDGDAAAAQLNHTPLNIYSERAYAALDLAIRSGGGTVEQTVSRAAAYERFLGGAKPVRASVTLYEDGTSDIVANGSDVEADSRLRMKICEYGCGFVQAATAALQQNEAA